VGELGPNTAPLRSKPGTSHACLRDRWGEPTY